MQHHIRLKNTFLSIFHNVTVHIFAVVKQIDFNGLSDSQPVKI